MWKFLRVPGWREATDITDAILYCQCKGFTFLTWNMVSEAREGRRGMKCATHNSRPSSVAILLINWGCSEWQTHTHTRTHTNTHTHTERDRWTLRRRERIIIIMQKLQWQDGLTDRQTNIPTDKQIKWRTYNEETQLQCITRLSPAPADMSPDRQTNKQCSYNTHEGETYQSSVHAKVIVFLFPEASSDHRTNLSD